MYRLKESGDWMIYIDEEEGRRLPVPKSMCMGLFEAGNPPAICNEGAYLHAVRNPVSGPPLREMAEAKSARTAAIIVSDVTRNVPTAKMAKHLVDQLVEAGVPLEGITFFVALGVHRNASAAEMAEFLGEEPAGSIRIENHDPYTAERLVNIGATSFGNEAVVNKKAYECDIKIVVGKVELHEMAGFSGGRKSILPGIAAEQTILYNHRPEMIFHPGTGAGRLEGNPIHEDMLETARLFGVDYCVSFVVDNSGQPAAVFCGGLEESHQTAANYLRQFCEVRLPNQPDIFIATPGNPLNCDLYQGVKALFALHHVLTPSSVVLLYGAFPEGVNSQDYVDPFHRFPDDLEAAWDYTWNNYQIQMDHTLPTLDILKRGVKVVVCAPTIPDAEIEMLQMAPCQDLEKALQTAIRLSGKECPQIAFCPHPQRAVITC